MSLSSHLEDKTSQIREFLRTRFSDTRTFLKDARKRVRSADTIRPDIDVPWGTIGMAADYRIRYYFDVTPHDKLVAYGGAGILSDPPLIILPYLVQVKPGLLKSLLTSIVDIPVGTQSDFPTGIQAGFRKRRNDIEFFDKETGGWLGTYHGAHTNSDDSNHKVLASTSTPVPSEIKSDAIRLMGKHLHESGICAQDDDILLENAYQEFFNGLGDLTSRYNPVATRLTEAQEDELNRYCVVLALLEEVSRGVVYANSPLFAKEHTSVGNLLDIPDADWIADMRNLSWRFYDNFNHLLSLPHSLNPTFDGSLDIGGADADLIVNGTLIDIKATITQKIRPDWLWQLLGYVLLDYSDHHRINSIGLYMARQGIFFQWDLEEAMRALCLGEPPSIEELRNEFERIVTATTHPALEGELPPGVTLVDGVYIVR